MAVIGAGMAGLASALELKRAGHDATVLEAQNRVGGRIFTCRDFAPGPYAEWGAMLYHAWIQGALESGIRAALEVHTAPG